MDERERNQYEYEKRRGYDDPLRREERNRRLWGGLLAVLLIIGGIWGWNVAHHKRTIGMERQVQQRTSAVRGYEANRQVATTTGQARVIKVDKSAIEKLKEGEPVDFYLSEFKKQGYVVTPIHKMKDHSTFVVHNLIQEGNTRRVAESGVLVTLHKDDKTKPDKVTSIETEDYKP